MTEIIEIRKQLSENNKNIRIFSYEELDSTNNEAKRLIAEGLKKPALIIAASQTAGRGRQGKAFFSPAGTGIYMTLVLHPGTRLENAVTVTTAAAVGVVRAIEEVTGLQAGIKWVNDIYIDGHKVAGILTEAVTDYETGELKSVIIGVGVNVSTEDFPDELRDIAGSLVNVKDGNSTLDKNRLIATLCNEIISVTRDLSDISYLGEYRAHSIVIGRWINYTMNGITYTGVARDIDETGGLMVETEMEVVTCMRVLRSGEISVRVI